MKKLVYQTCDSKECYNIEKDEIGLKNLYVVSRRHIYDDETNELICTTCEKISNLNDILIQDLKDQKKLERAEKKKNKSGQITVNTEKINIIEVSEQKVVNNNVVIEQKVNGQSVNIINNITEIKKGRGRPKKHII